MHLVLQCIQQTLFPKHIRHRPRPLSLPTLTAPRTYARTPAAGHREDDAAPLLGHAPELSAPGPPPVCPGDPDLTTAAAAAPSKSPPPSAQTPSPQQQQQEQVPANAVRGGAGGSSSARCLIVRPPMPPADAVLPVVDELQNLVGQHELQPEEPTAAAPYELLPLLPAASGSSGYGGSSSGELSAVEERVAEEERYVEGEEEEDGGSERGEARGELRAALLSSGSSSGSSRSGDEDYSREGPGGGGAQAGEAGGPQPAAVATAAAASRVGHTGAITAPYIWGSPPASVSSETAAAAEALVAGAGVESEKGPTAEQGEPAAPTAPTSNERSVVLGRHSQQPVEKDDSAKHSGSGQGGVVTSPAGGSSSSVSGSASSSSAGVRPTQRHDDPTPPSDAAGALSLWFEGRRSNAAAEPAGELMATVVSTPVAAGAGGSGAASGKGGGGGSAGAKPVLTTGTKETAGSNGERSGLGVGFEAPAGYQLLPGTPR